MSLNFEASTSSGRFLFEIAQIFEFWMAVERVVVESDFCIERHQAAIAGDDAGIDFHERCVRLHKCTIERLKKRHCRVHNFRREAESEGEFARLKRLQSRGGMNRLAQNRFGIVLRDFFDFHSAGGAGHKHGRAHRAIDENAEIKFALDVEAFFDQQAANDAPFRARLRSNEIHSEDALGMGSSLVG